MWMCAGYASYDGTAGGGVSHQYAGVSPSGPATGAAYVPFDHPTSPAHGGYHNGGYGATGHGEGKWWPNVALWMRIALGFRVYSEQAKTQKKKNTLFLSTTFVQGRIQCKWLNNIILSASGSPTMWRDAIKPEKAIKPEEMVLMQVQSEHTLLWVVQFCAAKRVWLKNHMPCDNTLSGTVYTFRPRTDKQ